MTGRWRLGVVIVAVCTALFVAGRIWPQEEASDAVHAEVDVDVDPATVSLGPGAELPGGLRVAAGSRVIGGVFGDLSLPDGSLHWQAPLFVDGGAPDVCGDYVAQQRSLGGADAEVHCALDGRRGLLAGRLRPPGEGSFPFAMAPVPELHPGPDNVPLPGVGQLRLPRGAELVHASTEHSTGPSEERIARFVAAFRGDWKRTLVDFARFARFLGWESALKPPQQWRDGENVLGFWGGSFGGPGDGTASLDLTLISRGGVGYVYVVASEPRDRR